MKKLRLLGLAALLAFTAWSQGKPAQAVCGTTCTTNLQCQQCFGSPDYFCVGHRCAT